MLPLDRFASKDTVLHARDLLGKRLVATLSDGSVISQTIVETEAYDGPEDLACHASKGRTKRTEVMFGPAGHWYVYLVYGVHQMLNLVTGPQDYPAAILIRGLAGISGPGRLTRALEIDRRYNAKPAIRQTGLYLLEAGVSLADNEIEITPRIGVDYAGPDWSKRPYRFRVKKEIIAEVP